MNHCPVHGYLLHNTPGENHFANFFCQCSAASHQPIGQWASTGDPLYTHPQPNPPVPPFPIRSTVTLRVPAAGNRLKCPICPESFPRKQERDRHLLKHVPYFMHCPLPHCAWRGNRAGLFKRHWQQENHRGYHEYYGHTSPGGSQIETYDPWVILDQIINGAISLREGQDRAIVLVQVKAYELQKPSMWMDPWGRK
ncbi:hypothetical protein BJY52DRAFT_1226246 [Lactarius psammicola]|nr:hypothetical protein BJY52DRAFT_1226246 [Lactarius psammicola]